MQPCHASRRRIATKLGKGIKVFALDAAMPFDFEHRAKQEIARAKQLTVGIVGFGTFGQFLAKRMLKHGHKVIATSRTPYHDVAAQLGVGFFQDADDFCEEHPDVVILASSILSTEAVLQSLPVQRLRRNTLFVDVLSVKVFPKQLMLATLPAEVDVLCTHPMFGPDSGKGSWEGLNLMFEKVRIGPDKRRQARCDTFLQMFRDEGCRMVEMSCEEHDVKAASTQFITHTVGRMLGGMQLSPTDIDTKGFQSLLNLVENTTNDSFDLYYGLFLYNQNATDELHRLERAFDAVRIQLFDRLHGILREQLFHEQQQGKQQQQPAALPESTSASRATTKTMANGAAAANGNGVAAATEGVPDAKNKRPASPT